MDLVCHIGTPKTATTYLQDTCAGNPDWLRRRGLVYADLLAPGPNHVTLACAATRLPRPFTHQLGLYTEADLAAFRARLSERIAEEVAAAPPGCHTMVMSSENLSGKLGDAGAQGLVALLAPHFRRMRFPVWLRRQDEALLGLHAETVKRGYTTRDFEAFLDRALSPESIYFHLDYRRLVTRWEAAAGREALSLRLFERTEMRGGDVLTDFMAELLEEDSPDLAGLEASRRSNATPSARALALMRRVPRLRHGGGRPYRLLRRGIERLAPGPRPVLTPAQSARIMGHFRDGNRWVAEARFGRAGPLFPEAESDAEPGAESGAASGAEGPIGAE